MFRQRAKGSLKLSDFPELKLRIFENIMEYPFVITSDVFNKLNTLLILKLLYPCLFKKFHSTNVIDIRFVRTPRNLDRFSLVMPPLAVRGVIRHSVAMPQQGRTLPGIGSSRTDSSQP